MAEELKDFYDTLIENLDSLNIRHLLLPLQIRLLNNEETSNNKRL